MLRQTILFDLDDTLVHCNKYFGIVIEQFVDQMLTWYGSFGITAEAVKQKQLEIDAIGIGVYGFAPDHFPQSFVETYDHYAKLTGRLPNGEEAKWLRKIGESVYDSEVEPYPHMVETLDELQRQGHSLYVYTGGVPVIQQKKIKALRLDTYFGERIFIRQHKTTEALGEIVRANGFDPTRTWMVGNSLRTDILPALETGIHAIHVPAISEWEYNIVEITASPKGAFLTIGELSGVPGAIAQYLAGRTPAPGQRAVGE